MDEEVLEAELKHLKEVREEALKELDFCIKFAESNGVVTVAILQGIRKRLSKKQGK